MLDGSDDRHQSSVRTADVLLTVDRHLIACEAQPIRHRERRAIAHDLQRICVVRRPRRRSPPPAPTRPCSRVSRSASHSASPSSAGPVHSSSASDWPRRSHPSTRKPRLRSNGGSVANVYRRPAIDFAIDDDARCCLRTQRQTRQPRRQLVARRRVGGQRRRPRAPARADPTRGSSPTPCRACRS